MGLARPSLLVWLRQKAPGVGLCRPSCHKSRSLRHKQARKDNKEQISTHPTRLGQQVDNRDVAVAAILAHAQMMGYK